MLTNNAPQDLPQGGKSGKKKFKTIRLSEDSKLTPKLIEELDNFLEYVPPERLSRNLRNLFVCYMELEKDQPNYFDYFIGDLYFLFQLLDVAEDEMK